MVTSLFIIDIELYEQTFKCANAPSNGLSVDSYNERLRANSPEREAIHTRRGAEQ